MPRPIYTVIVGNIGTVYDGHSRREADRVFAIYVDQSVTNYGRAAGETVTLQKNDTIIRERIGTIGGRS